MFLRPIYGEGFRCQVFLYFSSPSNFNLQPFTAYSIHFDVRVCVSIIPTVIAKYPSLTWQTRKQKNWRKCKRWGPTMDVGPKGVWKGRPITTAFHARPIQFWEFPAFVYSAHRFRPSTAMKTGDVIELDTVLTLSWSCSVCEELNPVIEWVGDWAACTICAAASAMIDRTTGDILDSLNAYSWRKVLCVQESSGPRPSLSTDIIISGFAWGLQLQ